MDECAPLIKVCPSCAIITPSARLNNQASPLRRLDSLHLGRTYQDPEGRTVSISLGKVEPWQPIIRCRFGIISTKLARAGGGKGKRI